MYGDKGYNSAPDEAIIRATGGGLLVPVHKDNMAPNTRRVWGEHSFQQGR